MTEHRYQADAVLAGACEHGAGGQLLGLITLTLTDAGPATTPDGTDIHRPDVICPLRVSEARVLAGRLLALADQLTPATKR